jgi:ribosome-binding factor A
MRSHKRGHKPFAEEDEVVPEVEVQSEATNEESSEASNQQEDVAKEPEGSDDFDDFDADANMLFGPIEPPIDRKTQQLCKQVSRVLSCVLSGEIADEVLQGLAVDSVIPAPNASRLQVTLFPTGTLEVPLIEVYARLEKVHGHLRSAVAEDINRKRAPELSFVVVPAMFGEEGP